MIDSAIHKLYKEFPTLRWFSYDENFAYYYAEDRLYVIKNCVTGAFYLVEARSPEEAIIPFLKRSNAYDNDMHR